MKKHNELVIIKVYRDEEIDDDLHDIMCDHLSEYYDEIKEYGKNRGKRVLFNVFNAATIMSYQTFDFFAEIEYTGEMSEEEKDFYCDKVSNFCVFGATKGRLNANVELSTVIFKKIEPDEIRRFRKRKYDVKELLSDEEYDEYNED